MKVRDKVYGFYHFPDSDPTCLWEGIIIGIAARGNMITVRISENEKIFSEFGKEAFLTEEERNNKVLEIFDIRIKSLQERRDNFAKEIMK